jgi:hypothetical protein
MPGSWNSKPYLGRSKQWQEKADALPPGRERDACAVPAEGYAGLAELIENWAEPQQEG